MNYQIIEKETFAKVKGEDIKFIEKIKIDKETKKKIFDPELEQENDVKLFNEYRRNKNLLMPEKIKEIRQKFKVSQVVFAQVLGFGDKTITRYENGSIQDMAQNNLINAIGEKPILFLENFKNCIKLKEKLGQEKFKDELYKIEKRVNALVHFRLDINKNEFNIDESKSYSSKEIAKAILNLYPSEKLKDSLTQLKLQKLLYFVEGNFIGIFGKSLINETLEAWVHGPVYRNIYSEYADYGYNTIYHKKEDKYNLEDKELEKFILKIIKGYGKFSPRELEKISHNESPWKLARKRANVGVSDRSNESLSKEEIKSYYEMLLNL